MSPALATRIGLILMDVWRTVPEKHRETMIDAVFDAVYTLTGRANAKVVEYFDSDSQLSLGFDEPQLSFDFGDDSEEHF